MVGVPALDGRPTPLGRSGLRDEHRASLAPFRARGQRLGPGILESPRSTPGHLGPRADAPIAEASDGRGRPIRPAFRAEGSDRSTATQPLERPLTWTRHPAPGGSADAGSPGATGLADPRRAELREAQSL